MHKRDHAASRISHPYIDVRIPIDYGIVDLIKLVWEIGIPTICSCENVDNSGYVMVGMPSDFWGGDFVSACTRRPISLFQSAYTNKMRYGTLVGFEDLGWKIKFGTKECYCYFPIESLEEVMRNLSNRSVPILPVEYLKFYHASIRTRIWVN